MREMDPKMRKLLIKSMIAHYEALEDSMDRINRAVKDDPKYWESRMDEVNKDLKRNKSRMEDLVAEAKDLGYDLENQKEL